MSNPSGGPRSLMGQSIPRPKFAHPSLHRVSSQADGARPEAASDMPLIPEHCVICEKPAFCKCSNCGTQFYCGRECQIKAWPIHRAKCFQANPALLPPSV